MRYKFQRKHLEAYIWIGAIIALALTDPTESHLSLCPLKNAGFQYCPGCGLGHSISWLFRGEWAASFNAHPLGIPAVIILLTRSIMLLKNDFKFSSPK
ncbi:DUF2752 domain-containing protein [Thermophagus xiamenensis]|uniref:DUF2752 domain-containing protein n=1 Tax=Thermophagus xiamenensis TaxID=385682 RepID=A0A1I2AKW5_9BACT|nr:DUF2752 domain-containing protein [Thermophagus xiamenensis]SFE43593.1 Protein of unknown function [Thermophagus xiamenensis]